MPQAQARRRVRPELVLRLVREYVEENPMARWGGVIYADVARLYELARRRGYRGSLEEFAELCKRAARKGLLEYKENPASPGVVEEAWVEVRESGSGQEKKEERKEEGSVEHLIPKYVWGGPMTGWEGSAQIYKYGKKWIAVYVDPFGVEVYAADKLSTLLKKMSIEKRELHVYEKVKEHWWNV